MTAVDIGWLAGILDGEGFMSLRIVSNHAARRGWSWRLSVGVSNTSMAMLERVRRITGRGWIGTAHYYKGKRLPSATWMETDPRRILVWLPKVAPELTAKRRHGELLIRAARIIADLPRQRNSATYDLAFTYASEQLRPITAEFEILNDRGARWRAEMQTRPAKRRMSDEHRAKVSAALRRRWAAWRAGQGPHPHAAVS